MRTDAQPDLFGYQQKPKRARAAFGCGSGKSLNTPPWESMAAWVVEIRYQLDKMRAASALYDRFAATARLLTVDRIRCCRHSDDLARVAALLEEAHYVSGYLHGLDRVWSRSERGELLVEVRNRLALLAMGRDKPRKPNPRFDIPNMPLAAIDRLIQSHDNMALVEQLRVERARRAGL